jgi:hypothetical protein
VNLTSSVRASTSRIETDHVRSSWVTVAVRPRRSSPSKSISVISTWGADDVRSDREVDMVFEGLAEGRVALVAVGVHGDLLDEVVDVEVGFVEIGEPVVRSVSRQKASVSSLVGRAGVRRRVLGMSKPRVA